MFPPRGIEPGFRGVKVKENKSQHLNNEEKKIAGTNTFDHFMSNSHKKS